MTDGALVRALVDGEPDGLARTCRIYADRLYTYCYGLLGDPDLAADALHDTLLLASRFADRLEDPNRLRPWLYALARNECLRRTGKRLRRAVPPGAAAPDPPGVAAPDPEEPGGAVDGELESGEEPDQSNPDEQALTPDTDMLARSEQELSPEEQELVELAYRHDLSVGEIAAIRGRPVGQTEDRLARARTALERALAEQWPAEADGHPTVLLPAYGKAPLRSAPALLWSRLQLHAFDPGLAPERDAVLRRVGKFYRETGFPRPRDRRPRSVLVAAVGAVVVLALAAGGLGVLVFTGGAGPLVTAAPSDEHALPSGSPGAAPLPPAGTGQPARPRPPARGNPTTSPSPEPTGSGDGSGPSRAPEPEPGSGSGSEPAPLAVSASVESDCVAGGLFGYRLVVVAGASSRLSEANLFVTTGGGTTSYDMEVEGVEAAATTDLMMSAQPQWWVEVTDGNGQSAATDPQTLSGPCT